MNNNYHTQVNGNVLTNLAEQNNLLNYGTQPGLNEHGEVELSEQEVTPVMQQAPSVVQTPLPPQPIPPVVKKISWSDYLTLPVSIATLFVILTYSPLVPLMELYIPKMDNLKGVGIRGIILAILVIVAKYIVEYVK